RLSPQTNERTRCRNDAGYLPKQESSIVAVNPVDVISVDVGQTSKLDIGMCYISHHWEQVKYPSDANG
ncbi:hypothetical protein Tco_0315332, partial [Tanacetum coccineum]